MILPVRSVAGVRVLVVDDSPSFREAARELLEARGYVVAGEAGCAAAATRAVERLAPDAVLLDVHLRDADGPKVAAELMRARPELAVLLVSADDLSDKLGKGSHCPGFVPKSQLARVDFARFWPDSRAFSEA